MTEPPPPRTGQANEVQADENQARNRFANGNATPSSSSNSDRTQLRINSDQVQPNYQLNQLEEPAPLPLPLPQRRTMIKRIFVYAVNGFILIGLFTLCVHIQREFYMKQLLKYSPSPSPFQNPKPEPVVETGGDAEPEPEILSKNYEPPSEALQKIPFLRKTEDEIYADQMKHVLGTLKQAVQRLDRGTNETQLAGVITMRPNNKEVNEVNVDGLEDEVISEDTKAEATKVVKDLVNRLTSALAEVISSPESVESPMPEVPTVVQREPDPSGEDPIAEILAYRSKYSARDRDLAKMIAGDNVTRDPKFAHEVDKREQLRRQLITKLIDYFFATEGDDDARIEKAYHYSMSEFDKQERYARLEAEIFGPNDLVGGGSDVIYGDYRRKMGYAYDAQLKTFISSSDIQKLKKMESRERKAFYAEMKILLKLEKRIKGKVVGRAEEEKRSEL